MDKIANTNTSSSSGGFHTTNNGLDLEKQVTESQSIHSNSSSAVEAPTTSSRPRVTRTQSLIRRNTHRGRFTHPLSHVKTTDAEVVDFDGLDDLYRPVNWPFRKKVITTLLYGEFEVAKERNMMQDAGEGLYKVLNGANK